MADTTSAPTVAETQRKAQAAQRKIESLRREALRKVQARK